MSTHPSELTSPNVPGAIRAWDRFWFDPVRPTTLGVIRIATGLIVVYVHLLYSLQLFEYFGENSWVNLQTINIMRKEAPISHLVWPYGPPQAPMPDPKTGIQVYPTLAGPIEILPIGNMPPGPQRTELERYAKEWSGSDPRLNAAAGSPVWSVWFHVTEPVPMMIVHALIVLVMILFTLGFATRITSVLTWIGAMFYIHRSQTTLFGMDTMMNILLIYLMIGPSGAALSLDRLIGRWWKVRQARKAGLPIPAWEPPAPLMSARFTLRLIQIHFCFIYLAAGTSKLLGSTWWGGTALWYCWANYEFAPFEYSVYPELLSWLSKHRLLWELACSSAVVFTLIMELGLPFLIWIPKTRWAMMIGAVMLHTGIALSMGLTTFGMFMLCMLLAFFPHETVERMLAKLPRPAWLVRLTT